VLYFLCEFAFSDCLCFNCACVQAKSGNYALALPSNSASALTGIIEMQLLRAKKTHNEGRRAHAPHPLYHFISKLSDHML